MRAPPGLLATVMVIVSPRQARVGVQHAVGDQFAGQQDGGEGERAVRADHRFDELAGL
jgi:hypothetical protein